MYAVMTLSTNGLWQAYTQFGTRTIYTHDAQQFDSRKTAADALALGKKECGHTGFKVVPWDEAQKKLLQAPRRAGTKPPATLPATIFATGPL